MAQVFSLRDSLEGATRGAAGVASMDQYASGVKRQNTIDDLAQSASGGGEQEIKRFAAMDPAGAANLISVINGMDKIEKDKRKSANEEVAKAVIFAEQGQTPEEKAARWDQGMQFLSQVIPEAAKDVGQYSPEKSQQYLMRAMSLDQLLEDSEKGEIKPGLDEKGNPVWTVIDAKKATAKIVPGQAGRRPKGAGAGGKDSRTALQKNVPFVAKKMKITEKEAAELLTASKSKSPQQTYVDVFGRALSSTFGDKEEATKISGEVMGLLYGEDWESKLPAGKTEKSAPAIKDYLEKQRLK